MRKVLIIAICVLFAVGCHMPRTHTIDVAKIKGCNGFKWTGRVTVKKTYKGLFTGYSVDLIELESRDGRALLIDTQDRGKGIDLYVKAVVETTKPEADKPPKAQQKQNSADQ